jgi:hypothetical protein
VPRASGAAFAVIIDSLPQPTTTYRNRLDRLAGSGPGNVRFGSKADIKACPRDVRYTPQKMHGADRRLIFCLEIALNQVGNFQIVAFGSLA